MAARKLEDAKQFAAKHGIEKAYGTYEELAEDANIDVVLIIKSNRYWNRNFRSSTLELLTLCIYLLPKCLLMLARPCYARSHSA